MEGKIYKSKPSKVNEGCVPKHNDCYRQQLVPIPGYGAQNERGEKDGVSQNFPKWKPNKVAIRWAGRNRILM